MKTKARCPSSEVRTIPETQTPRLARGIASVGHSSAWPVFLGLCGLLLFNPRAHAARAELIGPDKSGSPLVEQPGWHKGIVELIRHSSRVYLMDATGNETIYFKASPDEINELIHLFSEARLRDHEIHILTGTNSVVSARGTAIDYNVSLQVLYRMALVVFREKTPNETLEPRLTIYVGENSALLKQLKLPANIHVHSEVPGADFPDHPAVPTRKAWYARVQFDDGKPLVEAGSGSQPTLALWDNDSPDAIPLGWLSRDGQIQVALNDSELASLRSGKSWLTVTAGNALAQPTRTDPKFPPGLLTADQELAKPFTIRRTSDTYYGRILFEDGAPAVLTNLTWPSAEIFVTFPYAGRPTLDAEGFFKVQFTPEQFAELRTRKPEKNIVVPVDEHRARATDIFPAELLSTNKATAGVVRIARPIFDSASAPSLLGKPLPSLTDLQIEPSPGTLASRPVVVCFFDLQERPSRNAVAELLKQAEDLKSLGVDAILIQSSAVDRAALRSYAATNLLSIPVGMISTNEARTQFGWGVKGRPWLILADKDHVVRAEGFGVADLPDKLKSLR
jgi:hypothetical protein